MVRRPALTQQEARGSDTNPKKEESTTTSALKMSNGDETDIKRLIRQRIGHVAHTRKCATTIKDLCNIVVSDFTEENLQTLGSMRDIVNDKLAVIQAKNEKTDHR